MSAQHRARLGDVPVGDGLPVVLMGVLNVSPESFYAGSVHRPGEDLLGAALAMVDAGADLIDVGARSTAPYLSTEIPEEEEARRLAEAMETLVPKLPVAVSADTARPGPARAALEAGARILNDVGTCRDPALAALALRHDASLIIMASPATAQGRGPAVSPEPRSPIEAVKRCLAGGLARARTSGMADERIVLDPGIGFFRGGTVDWVTWDVAVLAAQERLAELGRPLCVGVSRKSFLGAITGREGSSERLSASLAATTIAVLNGAAVIRTHDVAATRDAVRVAERFRRQART